MRRGRTALALQVTVLVLASLLEVAANFAANDVQSGTVRALVRLALPSVVVLMLLVIVGNIAMFRMDRGPLDAAAGTGERAPFPADRATAAAGQIADQLAAAVRGQWEAEAAVRRLNDPHPLPVAWDAAEDDLVEDWPFLAAAVANWPGGPRSDPAGWAERPDGLRGSNNDLGEVLSRRVPTGRLIVLGEPGAGKSMLLVRLVLDLLARREPGGPVPVLVPLASWNPREQGLHAWLGARLAMDHSGLRAPFVAGGVNRVQALLARRLLIPVLDGLDEMPEAMRGLAITRINDAIRPGEWLVVSSRLAEYRDAVCPEVGPPAMLRDAAGIILHDVDAAAVETYLRRDAGGPAAARWGPVLAVLGSAAPVAEALRTPLMVGLARTIYNPRPGEHVGSLPDPADLCDTARLPTAADVRRHLFDVFIRAAYRPRPEDAGAGRRWRAADAQRWLLFLARHLERRLGGTTDLAWWELRASAPRPAIGLAVGALCGVASGFAAAAGARVGMGFGVGLGSGIGLALAVGLPIRRRIRFARGPGVGLAAGLAGGMVGGLVAGVASEFGVGLAPGPAGGLSAGLGVGVGAGPAGGLLGGFAGSVAGGLLAGLLTGLGAGAPAGIVNGLGVGLGAGLTVGLAKAPQPAQRLRWSSVGLIGGLAMGVALALTASRVAGPAVGIAVGLAVGLVSALVSGLVSAPADLSAANGPRVVLARDRRAFAALGLSAGTATGLVAALVVGLAASMEKGGTATPDTLLINGLGAGIAVGLACGLVLAFVQTAWGGFAVARCWLALRGRLPWRLASFLADAHEHRGVLRQVGAVYQFRHAELQRRLVAAGEPPRDRDAAIVTP